MSIPVELNDLRDVAAGQAPFAYLLTVSDDDRPHAVALSVFIGETVITADAGRKSCANASRRPDVSLLWPPTTPEDYSLIVDGHASVDGSTLRITPVHAIRHRPAPGGGSDCAPVALEPGTAPADPAAGA